MIYDRTAEDVNNALIIRAEKIQKGIELTDDDKSILERGMITINTINRIESAKQYLFEALNGALYQTPPMTGGSWTYSDVFKLSDFNKILEDIKTLKNAFFAYDNTPEVPKARFYFENINDVEKNIHDMQEVYDGMVSRYKHCGNFNCGG